MSKKLLLGLTGSVASTLAAKMAQSLIDTGFEVMIVITDKSLPFIDPQVIPAGLRAGQNYGMTISTKSGIKVPVYSDADEWPERKYRKDDVIPHIYLRDWADGLLIAPLSANTLAKMANGLCDNLLTSVVRAWDVAKPVIIAPAMNTLMWQSPFSKRHIETLSDIFRLTFVPPAKKVLACGQEGDGALADISDIIKLTQYAMGVGR